MTPEERARKVIEDGQFCDCPMCHRLIAEAIREAIEDAAKVADSHRHTSEKEAAYINDVCRAIAAAIRALKDK